VSIVTLEPPGEDCTASRPLETLPEPVREAVRDLASAASRSGSRRVPGADGGRIWLLRAFSRKARMPGVLMVELDLGTADDPERLEAEADALLEEAAASIERLDVATTVAEAEVRRRSEALREAIVGSTSHSLRTPLASIMGAASVLAGAPAVAAEPRLASLAGIIVAEAERLNGDIQKMLDAAVLSGSTLEPAPTWIEVADLVNAVLDARQRELGGHPVQVVYEDNLPLVRADQQLASGALGLVIDNAARYSEAGRPIRIIVGSEGNGVAITVEDEGIGLDPAEAARVFDKFFRGTHVRETTRGTGLGLWIANAFVSASRGRITAAPREDRPGTRVTILLPAATAEQMVELGETDE
jgi:two-component system, OmpR family, sensor histidine kinase KdpD